MRNALIHFFRTAGQAVERRTLEASDPADRIVTYLRAVADELRPASPAFFADVAADPDARAVYERNTRFAAERVSELIAAGARDGTFRAVDAGFVADLVAAEMTRIQSGAVRDRAGLDDAAAYDELAQLVLNGIAR